MQFKPGKMLRALLLMLATFPFQMLSSSGEDASASFDHGDREVSLAVADLPGLKDYVYEKSPIWIWLSQAFDYSKDGIKIYWDPGPTLEANTFGGETEFLGDSRICYIRIDRKYKTGQWIGVDKRAEEVLACLVLELNNARRVDEVNRAWELARMGKISRQNFILDRARIEFKAEAGVKSFLFEVWVPYCKAKHIQFDYNIWWACQPETFEDWMKLYPAGSDYPWKIYGGQFDQLTRAAK